MSLEVTIEDLEGGCKVVRAVGEIDLHSIELFDESVQEAAEAGPKALFINLSGVDFMSSSGIGVIMGCTGEFDGDQNLMVLVGLKGAVKESLRVIGLLDMLPMADTEEEALKIANAKA